MYDREPEGTPGFAAGLITGALIGAGLALLMAPKSGIALRNELEESWTTLRDAVGRRYRGIAARAGVELVEIHEPIHQTAKAVESTASALVDAASRETRNVWGNRGMRD